MTTPLDDPALRGHYRQPRSAEEVCREGHANHMLMADQDGWLKDLMALADERKRMDEEWLEEDLATFRRTGKMPAKSARKRSKQGGRSKHSNDGN